MFWDGEEKGIIPVEPLVKLAEIAKLDRESFVHDFIFAISATNDPELARTFVEVMQPFATQELLRNFPFNTPLPEELYSGLDNGSLGRHIFVGKVKDSNTPFSIDIEDLRQHFLILGRTGSGKTNLNYWIIAQCIKKGIAVWAWDREKQDYRHLKNFFPELRVIQIIKHFKINPLAPPPGVIIEQWNQTFVDTFCRTFGLLDGSENLLTKVLDELYHDYGVFASSKVYPSLADLFDKFRKLKFDRYSRDARFRDSIMNRLSGILALNHEIYDCATGFSLEELSTKSVVWELTGLSEKQSRFLLNIILYWLFNFRIANQARGGGIRNIVVVDEGSWLFPPFVNPNTGWPPISKMLAQLREFGVGILASDQTAQLQQCIFVNSFVKVAMSMGSGEDLEKIRKTFSLKPEQLDYMHCLKTGEAVVRRQGVEKPFVIETQEFPLK